MHMFVLNMDLCAFSKYLSKFLVLLGEVGEGVVTSVNGIVITIMMSKKKKPRLGLGSEISSRVMYEETQC